MSLDIIQLLVGGFLLGGIYGLAAFGLSITFGVLNVLNLAHGEFMMLGAYVTYVVQSLFKPMGGFLFELYFPISLVADPFPEQTGP